MSAKKKKAPKTGAVFHMSAEEATLSKMPKFNGYAIGHGAHGSNKYDRNANKRNFKKFVEDGRC